MIRWSWTKPTDMLQMRAGCEVLYSELFLSRQNIHQKKKKKEKQNKTGTRTFYASASQEWDCGGGKYKWKRWTLLNSGFRLLAKMSSVTRFHKLLLFGRSRGRLRTTDPFLLLVVIGTPSAARKVCCTMCCPGGSFLLNLLYGEQFFYLNFYILF